jgi:Fe-S-cluster-containing hydrogenase component 2
MLWLIAGNLADGPATVRLPDSVPPPSRYRGRVILDPSRCLACRICAYVCVSDAITGAEEDAAYAWAYEPGRCTFCARCLDRCPGDALVMASEAPPAYFRLGELGVRHLVPFPVCPECGAPVRPVSEELLGRAFEHLTDDIRDLARRCERCRRRRLQRSLTVTAFEDPVGKRR